MTIQGRSLDDLPLAAYSTGAEPDPRLDDPDVVAPPATVPGAAVPPIDVAAMGALPRADGEPDRDANAAPIRVPVGRPLPDVRSPSLRRGWVAFEDFAHWERW